jgi:hypothetical protein
MNNKPQSQSGRGKQSWGEIQLAIAAVALTATLAFWNLFSAPQKQQVLAQTEDTPTTPPQDPMQVATATPGFLPVKIIFGGSAPQQRVVVQAAAPQPKRKSGGGGGITTGSSKP